MNEAWNINSEELAAYVAGEADAALHTKVERWAASDPAHARELEAMRTAWEWTGQEEALPDVDVDTAWERVRLRTEQREKGARIRTLAPTLRWLAAAAVVMGVFLAARVFLMERSDKYGPLDVATVFTLKDSSRVTLLPNSHLEVSFAATRQATLDGEAYFEVSPDKARPFVVVAGDLRIQVLGTAFEVVSSDQGHDGRVAVRHGRVRVWGAQDSLDLTDGEVAVLDRTQGLLQRVPLPSSVIWGGQALQFQDASLEEVGRYVERLYGVSVELADPALARCRITAEFDGESIDEVLEVVAKTLGLQVHRSGSGRYTLEGDGC